MQYEQVILEMLSRIQTLENQVRELQQQKQQSTVENQSQNMPLPLSGPHRTNVKVTDEMLEECYQMGKLFFEGKEDDVQYMAEQVNKKTSMNRNNAIMTIFAVIALLSGELYKRGISAKATKKYFANIMRDYGEGALQRAIAAMRMHISYRRSLHHNVDLLETVCDEFQALI